ncbi:potassium transporter Kup [Lichenicoccus sp.]|uniref:potassium transporter Kup n=1 Tax=Lichenicoccus sp. TaxID=2781899 RepID=UPI003D0AE6E6
MMQSFQKPKPPLPLAMLTALGIVYGDLGTSPLYTMQTILQTTGGNVAPDTVLGVLSLIIWALLLTVSVKYGIFVMRADHNGEGGILALTSLVTGSRARTGSGMATGILLSCGLFGGALLYGDGILTPAISVLSAVEGVKVATPALDHLIMPIALGILVGLFTLQVFGTARIGAVFGPVMLLWFITIGGLGAVALIRHPAVLAAIDPRHGAHFLREHGWGSLAVLGGVFLSLTGAEALYADMGHVGRRPIRLAWYVIVLPALLLCYAGQSASLIGQKSLPANPFYGILPAAMSHWAIWPMVLLATAATIIASQAIITGVFSMTRQAIQLGWFPGLNIRQTSDKEYGQIYVPAVNWVMMLLTVGVTAGFGSSSGLAGAYGTAVSTTMLLTTVLLFSYLRRCAGWSLAAALPVAGLFLVIDFAFFSANLMKLLQGGWIPLLAGLLMFTVMSTWRRGIAALRAISGEGVLAPEKFLQQLADGGIPRVPGTVVFLTRIREPISPLMIAHVAQFGALQQHVVTLTVEFEETPRVAQDERITLNGYDGGLWHMVARYGFVEIPSLSAALSLAQSKGCPVVPQDALFVGGRDEVVRDRTRPRSRLPGWRRVLFGFMYRNAVHFVDRFDLPADHFVQTGRQVGL